MPRRQSGLHHICSRLSRWPWKCWWLGFFGWDEDDRVAGSGAITGAGEGQGMTTDAGGARDGSDGMGG
jgi:hypothetical protein